MEYTIKELETYDKSIWDNLSKGKDMCFFQSYKYFSEVLNSRIAENNECFFKVLEITHNNLVVMIAPIIICNKKSRYYRKGVYFIINGNTSQADYENLIYNKFDPQAFKAVTHYLKNKYNQSKWYFTALKESSELYKYLKENYSLCDDEKAICVKLNLPESFDEYLKLLSKSTKQNIRTAFNRANTDGIKFDVNFDDNKVDWFAAKKIYDSGLRLKNINQKRILKFKVRIFNSLSDFIFKHPWLYTTLYKSLIFKFGYNGCKIMTVKEQGKLIAYTKYSYDLERNEILILNTSTDRKFARYSPGLIAFYMFIKEHIELKKISTIDFTRGNEKYKYSLGGEEHYIHHFYINL